MEELLKKAMAGDKTALESIITQHQDMIYNLALRMLWHPEDAKDATQEILIRLITNLGKFSFRSSFKTWLYRLATNHLINYKQKHFRYPLTFELHENFLQSGLAEDISYSQEEGVRKLLVQEAKIGCSNAMLQCLDASQRAVYILGEILELNSQEGAEILEISPENFRQKLSRSRKKMDRHTRRNCGLVNPENACRCHRRVDQGIDIGFIQPDELLFVPNQASESLVATVEEIASHIQLLASNPEYEAPEKVVAATQELLQKI